MSFFIKRVSEGCQILSPNIQNGKMYQMTTNYNKRL
jgi:hypothetical protein